MPGLFFMKGQPLQCLCPDDAFLHTLRSRAGGGCAVLFALRTAAVFGLEDGELGGHGRDRARYDRVIAVDPATVVGERALRAWNRAG